MPLRVKEVIIIIILGAFIVGMNLKTQYKEANTENIQNSIYETANLDNMEKLSNSDFKKNYGHNANDYKEVMYYGHESEMECDTVLIVRLNDKSQGKKLIESIDNKRQIKKDLMKSYAPEQFKLLDESILEQKGKYVIYIVASNAYEIERAVLKQITG